MIELGDQRFVGSAAFRQNQQSYDAVPATWAGARQQAVSGDNWFGTIGYATPAGTISGFAYLTNQDEAAAQGFRLSSQTFGARFAGDRSFGNGWKLGYIASAARQSDYHRSPNDYVAHYYLGEATLGHKIVSATLGYEVLGADDGVASLVRSVA